VFLTDLNNFAGFDAVWKRYFNSPPPRTTIGCTGLLVEDTLVEIDLIGYVPKNGLKHEIVTSSTPRPLANYNEAAVVDGLVFAASSYGAGGGAVKLSKDASGAVKAEEVYFTSNMENHHGGMIVFDGCLYGANGGNSGGYLVCLDFRTGEVLWDERRGERSDGGHGRPPSSLGQTRNRHRIIAS